MRSHAELARVVRDHAGRLAASLMHVTGDFATAEDLVQDAVRGRAATLAGRRDPGPAGRLAVHGRPPPRPGRAAPRAATTAPSWRNCSGRSSPSPTTGCG